MKELLIKITSNDDRTYDILFDGELLATRGTQCQLVASIAAGFGLDEMDMVIARKMLMAGLDAQQVTGKKLTVSFNQPKGEGDASLHRR